MDNNIMTNENETLTKLGNCPVYPTGAKGEKLQKWYDNYEVMKMFHISQRTLQTLRSNGKLPFTKLGNKCFYREQDLQYMMMESFRDSRVKFYEHEVPDKEKMQKGGSSWR